MKHLLVTTSAIVALTALMNMPSAAFATTMAFDDVKQAPIPGANPKETPAIQPPRTTETVSPRKAPEIVSLPATKVERPTPTVTSNDDETQAPVPGANPKNTAGAPPDRTPPTAGSSEGNATTHSPDSIATIAKHFTARNGEIQNAAGKVVARYDTKTGQFTGDGGKIISSPQEQTLFKQVLANTKTATSGDGERADRIQLPSEGQLKSLGNGFNVNSAGDILKERKIVARLDAAGNIVSGTNTEVPQAMQNELKGLLNRIKLPISAGRHERSDPRITQKNLYVSATDKGDISINEGRGAAGGISATNAVSAIIRAAETPGDRVGSATPKGDYVMGANGEIKSPEGIVLGRYDASRKQFLDEQNQPITDGPTHALLEAVVARQNAEPLRPTRVEPSSGATTPNTGYYRQPGTNEILNARGVAEGYYDPKTGSFYKSAGRVITPNDPDYDAFKAAMGK